MNTPQKTSPFVVPGAPNGKTGQKRPFPQNIQGRVLFHDDDEFEKKYQPGILNAPKKIKRVCRNQVLPYPLSLGPVFDSIKKDPFGRFTWNTEVEGNLTDVQFEPCNFSE